MDGLEKHELMNRVKNAGEYDLDAVKACLHHVALFSTDDILFFIQMMNVAYNDASSAFREKVENLTDIIAGILRCITAWTGCIFCCHICGRYPVTANGWVFSEFRSV